MREIKELESNRVECLVKCFPDTFASIDKVICEYKNNPFMHILIMTQEEDLVGFLQYDLLYDRIEISQIEVKETKRHQGIGSSLLEELLQRAEGLLNITLEVREDNLEAILLYQKFGFVTVAVRSHYYGEQNGLLMERKLIK